MMHVSQIIYRPWQRCTGDMHNARIVFNTDGGGGLLLYDTQDNTFKGIIFSSKVLTRFDNNCLIVLR